MIIEVDGGLHSEQIVSDLERKTGLEDQGFCVLRFWDNQVLKETDGVKEKIMEALG